MGEGVRLAEVPHIVTDPTGCSPLDLTVISSMVVFFEGCRSKI